MSFTSEFKEFAMKGNLMDLALGVIIGAAFGNWFILLGNPPADFKGSIASFVDLGKAGVPMLAYGNFINVAINFIILAFVIFLMVRQINRMKAAAPVAPPAPPAPTPEDVVLLREIRDALNRR